MRCNPVSIFIERFGEYVTKDYPGEIQWISVYVDDSVNVFATLSKINPKLIKLKKILLGFARFSKKSG